MAALPELFSPSSSIRIPHEQDVGLTPRVVALLDTPPMQRLKRVSQLGLVTTTYPGATHSRFEHSLGVYRLACQVLRHFIDGDNAKDSGGYANVASGGSFVSRVGETDAKVFLVASLLHDVGHWPYCHPIEDIGLPGVPEHEALAKQIICSAPIAEILQQQWNVEPERVANLLFPEPDCPLTPAEKLLKSILDGPVDVDKMDYLQRDSLHAGVPYGRNFDVGRLVNSFCFDHSRDQLAISSKGKTAAEMMVFARYVMFSEVYWHHTVRSATAMLQRLVYELHEQADPMHWLQLTDAQFEQELLAMSKQRTSIEALALGLFGGTRQLYKRAAQYSFTERPEVHQAVGGRPFEELGRIASRLVDKLNRQLGTSIQYEQILLDAPPVKLEVQFNIQVRTSASSQSFQPLAALSPVVNTLATQQFDNFVKKIRVFAAPDVAQELRKVPEATIADFLQEAADSS